MQPSAIRLRHPTPTEWISNKYSKHWADCDISFLLSLETSSSGSQRGQVLDFSPGCLRKVWILFANVDWKLVCRRGGQAGRPSERVLAQVSDTSHLGNKTGISHCFLPFRQVTCVNDNWGVLFNPNIDVLKSANNEK